MTDAHPSRLATTFGAVAVLLSTLVAPEARAQGPGAASWPADGEAQRLAELLGRRGTTTLLQRMSSAHGLAADDDTVRGAWRGPRWSSAARIVWNSDLPYSLDDGALWAGRGASVLLRAGAAASWRPTRHLALDVVLAPELAHSQNRPFPLFPNADPARSAYANPWHGAGPASADLPLRFGDEPLTRVTPGQSAVTLRWRGVAVGGATENEWWGPGIRNALVLSANAEGVPHLFVRTAQPLRVPGGHLEAVLLGGTLTESRFYDTTRTNDFRALSGAALTYRLAAEPGLTLGVARAVVSPVARANASLGHALDALARWEPVRAVGDTADDGGPRQRSDQITSLFWRWTFAPQGFELYGELARLELPRSLREWLTAPQNTQGWTLGLQWARALRDTTRALRVQGEATYLEQSTTFTDRPPYPDFYAGRAAPQGFTQRGQVLGAAIGPGASSQWLATDYLATAWRAGLFLGRIRWENDALYRQIGANYFRHDVSLLWGLRGGAAALGVDAGVELTVQRRLNYLFQNSIAAPGPSRVVDLHNLTVALTLAPARGR